MSNVNILLARPIEESNLSMPSCLSTRMDWAGVFTPSDIHMKKLYPFGNTPNRGVEPLCAIMSFDPDGLGW